MMRSISYVLGGKPTNTADCVDYASKHKAQKIILTLRAVEEVNEQFCVKWLRSSFAWFFDDTTIAYDINFSGCFLHESLERQKESVKNANHRLEDTIDFIRAKIANIEIEGAEKRFGDDCLYLPQA